MGFISRKFKDLKFVFKTALIINLVGVSILYSSFHSPSSHVQAATAKLYMTPPTNAGGIPYAVGDTIVITVFAESGGRAIDSVEGHVTYEADFLNFVSVSTAGSNINFWATDPRDYDSSGGSRVDFAGGRGGGFTVNPGKLFSMTFTTRKAGFTNFLNGGRILSNGVTVSTDFANVTYQIGQLTPPQPTSQPDPNPQPTQSPDAGTAPNDKDNTKDHEQDHDFEHEFEHDFEKDQTKDQTKDQIKDQVKDQTKDNLKDFTRDRTKDFEVKGVEVIPEDLKIEKIFSDTHPDSDKWYSNNTPHFYWNLPPAVSGVSVYWDRNPDTTPPAKSLGVFSQYGDIKDLGDGIWYFHARLSNSRGWGPAAHYKFQVDKEAPDPLNVKPVEGTNIDPTEPRQKFQIESADKFSGLDYYEFIIDDGKPDKWYDDGSHIYSSILAGPGDHKLLVRAYDKAGNVRENKETRFKVEPIKTPVITEHEVHPLTNELILVKGKSWYSYSEVTIWLQRDGDEPQRYIVNADQDGDFIHDGQIKMKDGRYQLWVETTDRRGAKSLPSEKIEIKVKTNLLARLNSVNSILLALIVILLLTNSYTLFLALRRKDNIKAIRKLVGYRPPAKDRAIVKSLSGGDEPAKPEDKGGSTDTGAKPEEPKAESKKEATDKDAQNPQYDSYPGTQDVKAKEV
jgi:hypothetical protein